MQRKQQTAPATNSIAAVSPTIGEVLTVAETAALLKVPKSSVYEWTRFRGGRQGAPVPHRKVGKYLRFLRSELEAWIVGLPLATHTHKRRYVRKPSADVQASAGPINKTGRAA